jgi:hypothetical protein
VIHKALEEVETIQPGLEPRSRGIAAEQLVAHLREQERRAKYWTWRSLGATITLLTVMTGATLACYHHRLTDVCRCKATGSASRTSGDNQPGDGADNGQRQSASNNTGGESRRCPPTVSGDEKFREPPSGAEVPSRGIPNH